MKYSTVLMKDGEGWEGAGRGVCLPAGPAGGRQPRPREGGDEGPRAGGQQGLLPLQSGGQGAQLSQSGRGAGQEDHRLQVETRRGVDDLH